MILNPYLSIFITLHSTISFYNLTRKEERNILLFVPDLPVSFIILLLRITFTYASLHFYTLLSETI